MGKIRQSYATKPQFDLYNLRLKLGRELQNPPICQSTTEAQTLCQMFTIFIRLHFRPLAFGKDYPTKFQ